ncbi:efflux transporter outer membrane subunit [Uliginosibacterium sp. sgz301328]|uniref:efflux transporter outer membrane subunit n=1 Tax=Uliginosibacterium sp. sgz301328 TaxID=3243764 RepID=UPI00359E80D1
MSFSPRLRLAATTLALGAALAGCVTVGPDYMQPNAATSADWYNRQAGITRTAPDAATLSEWWHQFGDGTLDALIQQAFAANLDIASAQARLRQARAQRGVQAAQDWPTLDASASGRRSGSRTDNVSTVGNQYSAGFDASWEVDLFGGRRRALESADASVEAAQADIDNVRVSLAAEVATNYISLRGYEASLASTRASLATREETYQLTNWRGQAGIASALDVRQAQSNVEQTRASIPAIERSIEDSKIALAVLLARPRAELDALLATTGVIPQTWNALAVGIPADTLRQRPDVRAAERRLAAQTAQIGVAEAARYPSFTLGGSIGVAALTPAGLFSADTITSSILGSLVGNVFDGGRARQNVEIQNAAQEQTLATYQATLNQAVADVESALNAYVKTSERLTSLVVAVDAAREASQLAQIQYTAGATDLLTVLDAQRTELSLDDQLALAQTNRANTVVQLYKAMGGGWQTARSTNEAMNQSGAGSQ